MPGTSSSPSPSVNSGHTPLITSPGGTSNPIKISMSSLTEAATTGRNVLQIQQEADSKKGAKQSDSAEPMPEF